jgi:hypothetical protein
MILPLEISVFLQNAPNKARTGRWRFCGTYGKHFSGFEFFRSQAESTHGPTPVSANRWHAPCKISQKFKGKS